MNCIEFAINMELDGEEYYKEQATINKDNSLKAVFLVLAKDEESHARILKNKLKELSYNLQDNNTISEVKNVFEGIEDYKKEISILPVQLELYKEALEKEKQSISLYEKLLSQATDDNEKKLFEYLIKQEKDHYAILEDFALLISRPDEWVEASEFGIREEY